jgi:hypothetical protein
LPRGIRRFHSAAQIDPNRRFARVFLDEVNTGEIDGGL